LTSETAEPSPNTTPDRNQPAIRGRDIVCVGFNDWRSEVWTNQHHLMVRLARDNRVLFIESLGLRRPQMAARDMRRMARRLASGLRGVRSEDGLHVLSPLVLPVHDHAATRWLNARLLARTVARAARRLRFRQPLLWSYVPQAETLLDVLEPSEVVYHCVDDIAAHDRIDSASFVEAERRFAARADLVLASAPTLAERMRTLNPRVLYAPNVADTAAFATALEPGPVDPGLASLPEPRIVFVGAVAAIKLDIELLVGLARLRPSWSIALVGPVGLGDPGTDVGALRTVPNIHLLGVRGHDELPGVLRGASAGIVPYRLTRLTASIFPMKVYEYLAAGLPVVATPLPALEGLADVVVATDAPATAAALDALLGADSPERRARRSRAAATHSWDVRLAEIATALGRLSNAPGLGSSAWSESDRR
jgi:glycosyltransferase involved in cell wall biosynthesis